MALVSLMLFSSGSHMADARVPGTGDASVMFIQRVSCSVDRAGPLLAGTLARGVRDDGLFAEGQLE